MRRKNIVGGLAFEPQKGHDHFHIPFNAEKLGAKPTGKGAVLPLESELHGGNGGLYLVRPKGVIFHRVVKTQVVPRGDFLDFILKRQNYFFIVLFNGIFGRRQSAKLGKAPAGKGRKLLMFLCKPPKPHKNKANSEQQAHPRGVQNRPERQLIKKKRKGKNPAKQQKCETEKEL